MFVACEAETDALSIIYSKLVFKDLKFMRQCCESSALCMTKILPGEQKIQTSILRPIQHLLKCNKNVEGACLGLFLKHHQAKYRVFHDFRA